jgi:hypothetical protein
VIAQESTRVAGRLSITQVIAGGDVETIRVEIQRDNMPARLVVAELSLADFALCVTGRGGVPAVLRVFTSKRLP